MQMHRVCGKSYNSVRYATVALLKVGLLSSYTRGIREVYSLASDFEGAAEFLAFLAVLVREKPEYASGQGRSRTSRNGGREWNRSECLQTPAEAVRRVGGPRACESA